MSTALDEPSGGSGSTATEDSGPGTPGSQDTSGSTGEDVDTSSASGDSTGLTDFGTDGVSPPTIESFSVDGVTDNPVLAVSGGYLLQVVASDEGGVEGASFYRDGVLLGEGSAVGDGAFLLEWIVSGAADSGDTDLEVIVTGADGEQATAEIVVGVELPDGGVVEGWEFDGGDNSSVWGIHPDRDGDQVVWVGNFWN
ncbi:MAG: hypothetical protein KUG77_15380, partial [Nannocystaceae bacterium]|nr:hypothetical protein [Nannocystaceae bacterium]